MGTLRGGSCLVMWDWQNVRGWLRNWHLITPREAMQTQLDVMFANGQQRFSVAVPYGLDLSNDFYLDGSAGKLQKQDAANLGGLLSELANRGAANIILEMIPQREPENMAEMCRMMAFTCEVFDLARSVIPDPYRLGIDLWAEAIPPVWMKLDEKIGWLQAFWKMWIQRYGAQQSLGYSMICTQDRFDNIRTVYGDMLPRVWLIHWEGAADPANDQKEWDALNAGLNAIEPKFTIVGETRTDSARLAPLIARQPYGVGWVLQWPVGDDTPEVNAQGKPIVQDRIPVAFEKWVAAGF